MTIKELLEEQLKAKTKLKLTQELDISYGTLQRALNGETIRKDVFEKIRDKLEKEKRFKGLDDYKEPKPVKENLVKVTPMEDEYLKKLSFGDEFRRLRNVGLINILYYSKFDSVMEDRYKITEGYDREQYGESFVRMCKAVLAQEWEVDYIGSAYVVKLPSGHYLCKYDDGTVGWSIEFNRFSVKCNSKEALQKQYPEYSQYIVREKMTKEPVYISKERGFKIIDRVR
nr:MAG TPA: Transcriptional regulator, LacI family regulator, Lacl family, Protein.33A [Bacteriophage sp.]